MSTCWKDLEVYFQMDQTSSSDSFGVEHNQPKNILTSRLNRTPAVGPFGLVFSKAHVGSILGFGWLIQHVLVAASL
jgi:hypothetical protein